MPAILAIKKRFSAATLDLLTHAQLPGRQSVEEVMPKDTFSKVHRYEHKLSEPKLIQELKECRYDLYIELPNSLTSLAFEIRSMLLAKKAEIKHAAGLRISGSMWLDKWQEEVLVFAREHERLLSIVQADLNMPEYMLQQAEHEATAYWRDQLNPLPFKEKTIALIIAAGRPQNAWPDYNYQAVAKHFVASGYTIVLIGGQSEHEQAAAFANGENILNLCGKLNITETAGLLKDCDLAIANDTGAMHIAYNAGTPLIAIFSARDYSNKWFPPKKDRTVVLRSDNVPCANCFSDSCANNVCMQRITPAMVIYEAEKLLKAGFVRI
jgi:ADP-heptose:LPS heptosyltransferase